MSVTKSAFRLASFGAKQRGSKPPYLGEIVLHIFCQFRVFARALEGSSDEIAPEIAERAHTLATARPATAIIVYWTFASFETDDSSPALGNHYLIFNSEQFAFLFVMHFSSRKIRSVSVAQQKRKCKRKKEEANWKEKERGELERHSQASNVH